MRWILLLPVCLLCVGGKILSGEILDRVAIVVGQTVITEAQIDEELRVTVFLNHEPVKRGTEEKKAAAARLIEQELVRREVSATQYPSPPAADTDRLYAETEKEYGGREPMAEALENYHLNESILKDHLQRQLTILRFIDLRFRPDVEVSEQDVRDYYNRQIAGWSKSHRGAPPTLKESRASIEKSLSNERSEYALSLWLDEERKDVKIVYLDKELEKS